MKARQVAHEAPLLARPPVAAWLPGRPLSTSEAVFDLICRECSTSRSQLRSPAGMVCAGHNVTLLVLMFDEFSDVVFLRPAYFLLDLRSCLPNCPPGVCGHPRLSCPLP